MAMAIMRIVRRVFEEEGLKMLRWVVLWERMGVVQIWFYITLCRYVGDHGHECFDTWVSMKMDGV